MPIIEINGNVLDPENPKPASRATQSTNESPYVLVQSDSILDDGTYNSLRELKVHVLEYVSENTYLCRHSGNPNEIKALPFVRHVLNYDESFKVEDGLVPAESSSAQESIVNVRVTLHQDVELSDEITGMIEKAAGVAAEPKGEDKHVLQFNGIKRKCLRAIAAIPAVLNIFKVLDVTVATGMARRTMGRDALVALRTNNTDLKGGGQIIAVADIGLEHTHRAFARFSTPGNRILGGGVPSPDPWGHGTHVSGSIAGSCENLRGVAMRSQLFFQACWDQAQQSQQRLSVNNLWQLLDAAYRAGARVHNDSWGRTGTDMRYNGGGHVVDKFVWKNRDMVVCFAAGNDGVTIGCEAGSKNGITVGATTDRRVNNGNPTRAIEKMVAVQNRGPTREDRNKPDVVAPGDNLLSAVPGDGLDRMTGTSMSTALVSGCAAVVREALLRRGQAAPNAALVKAALICGADDFPHPGPVNRVNLANSVLICRDRTFEENNLRQGAEISYSVEKEGEPAALKVVLVWVDWPGERLQSQLGLTVVVDGQHPYSPYDPNSNVLEVRVDRRSSSALITIQARRITPITGLAHPRYQAFALAWRWLST